jgi:GTP cyclohydrolase I
MLSWENKPYDDKTKQEIIEKASSLFKEILELYGWDVDKDPNLMETPKRIAKSWFEIFKGSFDPAPNVKTFPINEMGVEPLYLDYNNTSDGIEYIKGVPVFVGPIRIFSMCSHHFLPIIGYAYVEYIPNDSALGLSKIPRLVQWVARRPSIQEKMTQLIAETIYKQTQAPVYVYIEAKHLCTAMRGVEEENALMVTEYYYHYTPEMLKSVRQKIRSAQKPIQL